MSPAGVIVISTLTALANVASDAQNVRTEIPVKRYHVAQAPEPAAVCISGNVGRQRAGAVAMMHPLYGMEQIAVIMRDSPTGETVATVFLEPANPGSHVKVIPAVATDDPEPLVKQLLAKC